MIWVFLVGVWLGASVGALVIALLAARTAKYIAATEYINGYGHGFVDARDGKMSGVDLDPPATVPAVFMREFLS